MQPGHSPLSCRDLSIYAPANDNDVLLTIPINIYNDLHALEEYLHNKYNERKSPDQIRGGRENKPMGLLTAHRMRQNINHNITAWNGYND